MRTRLVLATLPVALIGVVAAAPGIAGPKPQSKSYTAAASPDPTPNAEGGCSRGIPGGEFVEPLKITSPGKLVVEMSDFQGDWDLCVFDKSGSTVGSSTGFIEATKETVGIKLKKTGEYTIVSQNLVGGATAAMKYTFTPN
jgi:hypothetical protein